MEKVNREALLSVLESVEPGLAKRGVVEQTACFIFDGGKVKTFNEEIACVHKSPLKSITAAVQAQPLLEILKRLPEETVEVEAKKGYLHINGRRKRASINMEHEITLPDVVEKPGDWIALHPEFADAVAIVAPCASDDASMIKACCIHITSKFIEACDEYQIARYRMKTKIPNDALVQKNSLKHVADLGMTHVSQTDSWLHFKNPDGLIFSCQLQDVEGYPNMDEWFDFTGKPFTLPKGLMEALDRGGVFAKESADGNQTYIELSSKGLVLRTEGIHGKYVELKTKVKYSGKPMSFIVATETLERLLEQHTECELSPERLKVAAGKFTYVTGLGNVEEENDKKGKKKEKHQRDESE